MDSILFLQSFCCSCYVSTSIHNEPDNVMITFDLFYLIQTLSEMHAQVKFRIFDR